MERTISIARVARAKNPGLLVPPDVTTQTHREHLVKTVATQRIPATAQYAAALAEVFPVECVVRGYLVGSGWKDYLRTGSVCGHKLPEGLPESAKLPEAIFTPSTKAEQGHDENITEDQVRELIGAERTAQGLSDAAQGSEVAPLAANQAQSAFIQGGSPALWVPVGATPGDRERSDLEPGGGVGERHSLQAVTKERARWASGRLSMRESSGDPNILHRTSRTATRGFGTFAPDPDDEYIWTPSGYGRMEFLRVKREGFHGPIVDGGRRIAVVKHLLADHGAHSARSLMKEGLLRHRCSWTGLRGRRSKGWPCARSRGWRRHRHGREAEAGAAPRGRD